MFLSYKRCYISYHTYYREPKATELCPECKSPAHTHQEPSKTVPSRTPKPYHQKPRQKTKKQSKMSLFVVLFSLFAVFFGGTVWGIRLGTISVAAVQSRGAWHGLQRYRVSLKVMVIRKRRG
jgi:hypothetical protein